MRALIRRNYAADAQDWSSRVYEIPPPPCRIHASENLPPGYHHRVHVHLVPRN